MIYLVNMTLLFLVDLDEKDIAKDIEKYLIEKGVNNYQNLAAKTSILMN